MTTTTPPEPTLEVVEDVDQADNDFVHNGLRGYNKQFTPDDWRRLCVFLRDAGGAIVGGLLGDTHWGWLAVHILWLDERYRGQGYGDRILGAAEAEARARGCRHVQLDTFTFQARPFYEARGYRVFGQVEDYPAGTDYTRYYLTKPL